MFDLSAVDVERELGGNHVQLVFENLAIGGAGFDVVLFDFGRTGAAGRETDVVRNTGHNNPPAPRFLGVLNGFVGGCSAAKLSDALLLNAALRA